MSEPKIYDAHGKATPLFGDFVKKGNLWVRPEPIELFSPYFSMPNYFGSIFGSWITEDAAPPKEEIPFETNMMEALVGWKAWSVEDGILRSAQQAGIAWPIDQPLVARCKNGCTEVPREHHTCGIYAGGDREEAQGYADDPNELVGMCYGWGRYVRGSGGWRAQFAYPKCFYLKQHQAELIEPLRAYHVPIYVEQPVLMYNPEEDGYEYRRAETDGDCRAYQDTATTEEGSSSDEEDS